MNKISDKKLKELIAEEKQAKRMYEHYGFDSIAKQEAGHARTLSKVLQKRKV